MKLLPIFVLLLMIPEICEAGQLHNKYHTLQAVASQGGIVLLATAKEFIKEKKGGLTIKIKEIFRRKDTSEEFEKKMRYRGFGNFEVGTTKDVDIYTGIVWDNPAKSPIDHRLELFHPFSKVKLNSDYFVVFPVNHRPELLPVNNDTKAAMDFLFKSDDLTAKLKSLSNDKLENLYQNNFISELIIDEIIARDLITAKIILTDNPSYRTYQKKVDAVINAKNPDAIFSSVIDYVEDKKANKHTLDLVRQIYQRSNTIPNVSSELLAKYLLMLAKYNTEGFHNFIKDTFYYIKGEKSKNVFLKLMNILPPLSSEKTEKKESLLDKIKNFFKPKSSKPLAFNKDFIKGLYYIINKGEFKFNDDELKGISQKMVPYYLHFKDEKTRDEIENFLRACYKSSEMSHFVVGVLNSYETLDKELAEDMLNKAGSHPQPEYVKPLIELVKKYPEFLSRLSSLGESLYERFPEIRDQYTKEIEDFFINNDTIVNEEYYVFMQVFSKKEQSRIITNALNDIFSKITIKSYGENPMLSKRLKFFQTHLDIYIQIEHLDVISNYDMKHLEKHPITYFKVLDKMFDIVYTLLKDGVDDDLTHFLAVEKFVLAKMKIEIKETRENSDLTVTKIHNMEVRHPYKMTVYKAFKEKYEEENK